MSKKLRVIYIPGVGDTNPASQQWLVKTWQLWGVEYELLQMNWADETSWNFKFNRILDRIDELIAGGNHVALVGASAGGAAALSAYEAKKDQLAGVVLICGKLKKPSSIGPRYSNSNPALIDAVTASDEALKRLNPHDRDKIMTRRAIIDEVITTAEDSIVEGAHNRVIPTPGHSVTIATQLLFGAPIFLRFLKRQNT